MLKIVKDTQKSLREKSVPVQLPLSSEDKATLDEMLHMLELSQDEEYRKEHKDVREGVGLAAPQVGINKRMIVILYQTSEKEEDKVLYQLVNPRVVSESVRECFLRGGEGCLSVDKDHEGHVYRKFKIVVKAFDAYTNKDIVITARGFDAVVLQHELDHLDGILFYDHIDKKDPFKVTEDAIQI